MKKITLLAVLTATLIFAGCEKGNEGKDNISNKNAYKYYQGKSIEELVKMTDYSVWEKLYGRETNQTKTQNANNTTITYQRLITEKTVHGEWYNIWDANEIKCSNDTSKRCYTIITSSYKNSNNTETSETYYLVYKENQPEILSLNK